MSPNLQLLQQAERCLETSKRRLISCMDISETQYQCLTKVQNGPQAEDEEEFETEDYTEK